MSSSLRKYRFSRDFINLQMEKFARKLAEEITRISIPLTFRTSPKQLMILKQSLLSHYYTSSTCKGLLLLHYSIHFNLTYKNSFNSLAMTIHAIFLLKYNGKISLILDLNLFFQTERFNST